MKENLSNRIKAFFKNIWSWINATRFRKVFFYSFTTAGVLLLINLAFPQEFLVVTAIIALLIGVCASAVQARMKQSEFNKYVNELRKEIEEERKENLDKVNIVGMKRPTLEAFSPSEQQWIKRRKRSLAGNFWVRVLFIILLIAFLVSMF